MCNTNPAIVFNSMIKDKNIGDNISLYVTKKDTDDTILYSTESIRDSKVLCIEYNFIIKHRDIEWNIVRYTNDIRINSINFSRWADILNVIPSYLLNYVDMYTKKYKDIFILENILSDLHNNLETIKKYNILTSLTINKIDEFINIEMNKCVVDISDLDTLRYSIHYVIKLSDACNVKNNIMKDIYNDSIEIEGIIDYEKYPNIALRSSSKNILLYIDHIIEKTNKYSKNIIGCVSPFLMNSINALDTLYIINDKTDSLYNYMSFMSLDKDPVIANEAEELINFIDYVIEDNLSYVEKSEYYYNNIIDHNNDIFRRINTYIKHNYTKITRSYLYLKSKYLQNK